MRCAAPLLAALAFACPVAAQSVRGTAMQADSATRAAGVIVVASTEKGDVVARTLTGESGEFDLRLPGAGRYVLRFLRVGYRPTVTPPVAVPDSGITGFRAILGAEAVVLAAVTVKSENVCGTTQDAGRVIAQVWDEAKTALTATELSVGARSLLAEWQAFQFQMDLDGLKASDVSVLGQSGRTERPFVSVPPDTLARGGYVVNDRSTWIYHAPDAPALLSDQFAATHCFSIAPVSREHPHWVGVTFRPTPARRDLRDITGTVWLDRASSELRQLEFRYTNLPPEFDVPLVGGFVEFVRLTTGHWLVARWAIRMPRIARRTIGGSAVPGGGRQDLVLVQAIAVTGGQLLNVRTSAARLFEADRALVASEASKTTVPAQPTACGPSTRAAIAVGGVVTDRGKPVAGAVVRVEWAGDGGQVAHATVSDLRGRFILPCIERGRALAVSAVDGARRAGPTAVGTPTDRASTVTIEFNPSPERP